MADIGELVERAALLHDIGKLVLRANPRRETHSAAGRRFLEAFAAPEDAPVLRAVSHHHGVDLKALRAADDISYLVYEADNLAAGSDRREVENGTPGFSAKMPLMSVFNVFGEGRTEQAFYLRPLRDDQAVQYPQSKDSVRADVSAYQCLYRDLQENFQHRSPFRMAPNELLRVLEAVLSYVPSSTSLAEAGDISLYDHLRLTAAYAAAMYQYLDEQGVRDYRAATTGTGAERYRDEAMYLLASGDISGIQSYIYTIPSKGALKSLRGRSSYLELLLEHTVDEILTKLALSRSSLLYTGGGHFYLLLPNTAKARKVLAEMGEKINSWMMKQFADRLYLALAWTPCTAKDFLGEGTRAAFQRVNEALAKKKLQRYSPEQLQQLFDPMSSCNRVQDAARECAVCHTSTVELAPYPASPELAACPTCAGLYTFGERVLNHPVLCVGAQKGEASVPLPGEQGDVFLSAEALADVQSGERPFSRLYVKNEALTGEGLATHLWMGDYVARDERGHVLDFEDLALASRGLVDGRGISRLGVLRADVDHLGAAFLAGFPASYTTLTRVAALSRQLALFFKHGINALCRGEVNGIGEREYKKFSLFGTPKQEARQVHIIYSGGDDLFLVGAWDDILELAVDLHDAFARFTGGKLHFSAGVGLFKSRHPVADMARQTGRLEDAAKALPGKDGIALFGIAEAAARIEAYKWQDFIDCVCGEKLAFLQSHFGFEAGMDDGSCLMLGKSGLYRMMDLMQEEGAIYLTRFAYVLARMDPSSKASEPRQKTYQDVRQTLYRWYKSPKDRRELLTAIELIVYGLRERGESKDE